jgi:D-sedoheptulose 7-phosphate isomerase
MSQFDASHMAADLGKNTIQPHMRRFRIASLNDNTAVLTALANDLGYDHVFDEQLTNFVRAGDVLIVISASGNSQNVLNAMRYARRESAEVIGLLGFDGGEAATLADLAVVVPSDDYGVVEDVHLIINHMLVDFFKHRLDLLHTAVV